MASFQIVQTALFSHSTKAHLLPKRLMTIILNKEVKQKALQGTASTGYRMKGFLLNKEVPRGKWNLEE